MHPYKDKRYFEIKAKKLFFTYPKCPIQPEKALEQLKVIFRKTFGKDILEYTITREQHKDLNFHLHCFFQLNSALRTRKDKAFSLKKGDQHFRGNYQGVLNKEAVLKYILKRPWGSPLMSKNLNERFRDSKLLSLEETMMLLAEEGHIQRALDLYRKEKPKKFLMNHDRIEKSLQKLYAKKVGLVTKFPISSFNVPKEMEEWFKDNKGKTLWVSGPSGVGKTQLLLSMAHKYGMKPLRVTHRNDLEDFNPNEHKFLLFDDFTFPNKREDIIHYIESEEKASVDIKFGKKAIPGDTQKAVASNFSPNESFQTIEKNEALLRRIHHVETRKTLFDKNKNQNHEDK